MQRPSRNFIYTLAESARKTLAEGYYQVDGRGAPKGPATGPNEASASGRRRRRSLRDAIQARHGIPIIAEVKFRSPADGSLRASGKDSTTKNEERRGGEEEERGAAEIPVSIATSYERGGAAGISVLTEPKHFEGDIRYLPLIRENVHLPVLMKDVVVSPLQLEAADRVGADAILLMASIFRAGLSDLPLDRMVEMAHSLGLEVLLEAHTPEEYELALGTSADVVGINNRDLGTLEVSLETSRRLLLLIGKGGKVVISESGISTREQILELKSLGADGFLIGSALMRSKNIEESLRGLVVGV